MGGLIKAIVGNSFLLFAFLVAWSAPCLAQAPSAAPTPPAAAAPSTAQAVAPVVSPEDALFQEIQPVIIQSAGFFKMDANKTAGSATVISQDTMQYGVADNLGEMLEDYVPGMDIGYNSTKGTVVGTRGILLDSSAKTIVMRDGQSLNSETHYAYNLGYTNPMMGDIDHVEVVLGPGAIQYGSGAISGLINMIPKTGTTNPGTFATMEYGFEDYLYKYEFGYGKKLSDGDIYVYAGYAEAKGFPLKTGDVPPNAISSNNGNSTLDPNMRFDYSSPSYKLSSVYNKGNFHLDVLLSNWSQANGSAYGFMTPNPASPGSNIMDLENTQTILNIAPKYTFHLTPVEDFEWSGTYQAMDNGQTYINHGEKFSGNNLFTANAFSEQEYSTQGILRSTRITNNSIALGFNVGHRSFSNGDPFFRDMADYIPDDLQWHWSWFQSGIFAEDVINVTDKLTLDIGGREDWLKFNPNFISMPPSQLFSWDPNLYSLNIHLPYSRFSNFSPKAAVSYQLDDLSSVKLSYQHGFRYPDPDYYLNNAFGLLGGWVSPNFNSYSQKIETMDSFDLGYDRLFLEKKLSVSVDTYCNILKNTLGWESGNGGATQGYTNIPGHVTAGGGEITGKYKINEYLEYNLAYGYAAPLTYPKSVLNNPLYNSLLLTTTNGRNWNRYHTNQIKTGLVSEVLDKKLRVELNGVYYSQLVTNQTTSFEDNASNVTIYQSPTPFNRPVYEANFSMRYAITKNIFVKLTVSNMFRNWGVKSGPEDGADYGAWQLDNVIRKYYVTVGVKF